jgi:hypothetical protein
MVVGTGLTCDLRVMGALFPIINFKYIIFGFAIRKIRNERNCHLELH